MATAGWPFIAVLATADPDLIAEMNETWDIGSVRPSVHIEWIGEVRTTQSAVLSVLSKSCSCVDVRVSASAEADAYLVTAGALSPPYGQAQGWIVMEARCPGRVEQVRIELRAVVVFDTGLVVAPKQVHVREGSARPIEVDVIVVMDGSEAEGSSRSKAPPNLIAEPAALVTIARVGAWSLSVGNSWSVRIELTLAETAGGLQEQPLLVRISVEGAASMSDSIEIWGW